MEGVRNCRKASSRGVGGLLVGGGWSAEEIPLTSVLSRTNAVASDNTDTDEDYGSPRHLLYKQESSQERRSIVKW